VLGGLGLDLGCHLATVAPLDRRLGMDFRAPHFHRLEAVCTQLQYSAASVAESMPIVASPKVGALAGISDCQPRSGYNQTHRT
jgi:hypothetical protein